MWISLVVLFCIVLQVRADVYLHNPRGSNNRLDERGRERANANRMFDSQNNNRGGYNVGSLYYYPGSVLPIEWTNQHSCGEANANCELIVQYMCSSQLRDGTLTKTIPEKNQQCQNYDCNSDLEYGMHENLDYYLGCKYTERNEGLFTADQNMNNRNAAINTRQNPKGTRRAYECPEERDYYPYWRPSPWKDIAIMTNDITRCPEYQAKSANVASRWYCKPPPGYLASRQNNQAGPNLALNKEDCNKITYAGQNANWTEMPAFGIEKPDCLLSPQSRDNHNGNGPGGFPNMYNWTIPSDINDNCALRLRYNVSTGEFASNITAALNANNNNNPTEVDIAALVGLTENEAKERGYVFEGNPTVQPLKATAGATDIGAKLNLQLAINTAQYGRTFQDRSHSFQIRARPATLEAGVKIHNLNVRGKRGNIVQVYPAVEYDFVPNRLEMNVDDYIHPQWTGSNTNPENNDGQGLRGTDRSNIAVITSQQYPEGTPDAAVPAGQKHGHWGNNYPEHLNAANFLGLPRIDRLNLAILSPGQFKGELSELDDAGTYFDIGPRKITSNGTGTYHYMCTRNNNFSNRSQKGRIVVNSTPKVEALVGWNGGQVTIGDGSTGVWVEQGALTEPARIEIQEWPSEAGEKQVKSVPEGSGYESKFFVMETIGAAKGEQMKVTVQMKVDSSSAIIYHSGDGGETWVDIGDYEYNDGVAKFTYSQGGIFVARSDNSKRNVIIGVVVALVIVAILVFGVVIYCRKNPGSMASTKRGFSNFKLGARGKV